MKTRTRISVSWYVLTRFKPTIGWLLFFSCLAMAGSLINMFGRRLGIGLIIAVFAISMSIISLIRNIFILGSPSMKNMELELSSSLFGDPFGSEFPLKKLVISNSERSLGFKLLKLPNGGIVSLSDDIDKWLLGSPTIGIKIHRKRERKLLMELILHWEDLRNILVLKARRPARFFNEKKISLISRLSPSVENVSLSYTTYFTSCVTNEASSYVIKKHGRVISDFRFLFPATNTGSNIELTQIEATDLSNHIGVSMLAKTKDGYLICWGQNARAQQNVGEIVPTASGSLDWKDLKRSPKSELLSIVRYGMARELHEESSLGKALAKVRIEELVDDVSVIGYFRWLVRGGKPEFIGIGRVQNERNELAPQLSEVERPWINGRYIRDFCVENVKDVLAFCEHYLGTPMNKAGIPLAAICLRLRSILTGSLGQKEKDHLVDFWGLAK